MQSTLGRAPSESHLLHSLGLGDRGAERKFDGNQSGLQLQPAPPPLRVSSEGSPLSPDQASSCLCPDPLGACQRPSRVKQAPSLPSQVFQDPARPGPSPPPFSCPSHLSCKICLLASSHLTSTKLTFGSVPSVCSSCPPFLGCPSASFHPPPSQQHYLEGHSGRRDSRTFSLQCPGWIRAPPSEFL